MKKMTKYDWLEVNGFSREQITYIVMGNSYAIKDSLKDAGFKFSALLRWHTKSKDFELPDDCYYYELKYEDIFEWDEGAGVSYLRPGARSALENLFITPIESASQYIGNVGDRINALEVRVKSISGFDSDYGYKQVFNFEDIQGNVYTWFTTTSPAISVNQAVTLSGTIKKHSEYRGMKTTQLTNCRIKAL